MNLGGVTADGRDAANALSYLCLEVTAALELPQPQVSVLVSTQTPDRLLLEACRVIRMGFGMPAVYNDDEKVLSLLQKGKTLVDARLGGINGCVEVVAPGKDRMASSGYLNMVKCLELALNDGVNPVTGNRLGPPTGDPAAFRSFADLLAAFREQLAHAVRLKATYDAVARQTYAEFCPVPFTSLLISDCLEKGRDYHDGGARYNLPLMCGVGTGTLADSLAAIRTAVFEQQHLEMPELIDALRRDFEGAERLRQLLLNRPPKWGNGQEEVDALARGVVDAFCDELERHTNEEGTPYAANMIPTTTHIWFGDLTGATPDGRRAGVPLSEGVSPVQGMDRNGPTAVVRSLARLDHARTAGTLAEHEAASVGARRRGGPGQPGPPHPRLLHLGRPSPAVQRRLGRRAAGGAGAPGGVPDARRPRGGVQRLLRPSEPRPAGRDHLPERADVLMQPPFLPGARLPLSGAAGDGGSRSASPGWVSNIQRFSVHDGPGIRTTVFLQGCPLHCLWCSNPEAQEPGVHIVHWEDRCLGCDACRAVCPRSAIRVDGLGRRFVVTASCDGCGRCLEQCYPGALEQLGRLLTVREVLDAVEADRVFYDRSGGGMTLSGGEPMAQPEFCLALLAGARALGIATCMETCGQAPWALWEQMLPYLGLVLYDLKEVDRERHERWTGVPNDLILDNLRRLAASGTRVIVRRPVIPGCNDDEESLLALADYVGEVGLREIHLLPYHRLAQGKYERLGQEYLAGDRPPQTPEDLLEMQALLTARGLSVKIGG